MTRCAARRRGLVAIATLTLAAAAACTVTPTTPDTPRSSGPAPSSTATPATPTAAPSPTRAPEDTTAKAKRLAAHYDYDAALAALPASGDAAVQTLREEITKAKASAVTYPDNTKIPHIFYHSLIVDPARAFKAPDAVGYSQYMVTMKEFSAQIAQLHQNGYVLVHPQRIAAKGPDGVMRHTPIVLPPGKKPIVLSLDDISYYEYMTGKGFATDLFIDGDGRVRNHYTDAAGKVLTGSYDCIPVLDDFVKEHPDFSYRGDMGTIALTGYNGVLGYRTSISKYGDTPATRDAIAQATKVATAIKDSGWRFASHTWGHINLTESSLGRIQSDTALWNAEVRPVVGATNAIIFAFGGDISGLTPYAPGNPKYDVLRAAGGFEYFFPVDGSSLYWSQLSGGSFRQSRINVDGIRMQTDLDGKTKVFATMFNVKSTLDPARPMPVPLPGAKKS